MERADIIVDFSAAAGTSFRLLNLGPDEPFGGGEIGTDFEPSALESGECAFVLGRDLLSSV